MRIQKAERVKQITREGGATGDRLWGARDPEECEFDCKEGTIVVNSTYVNFRDRVFTLTDRGRRGRNTAVQQNRDPVGRSIRPHAHFTDSLVAKYAL